MSQTMDNRAYYLAQIHQLKQLQKVDDSIYVLKRAEVEKPQELDELKSRYQKTSLQRDQILEKIAHLREQETRLARESEEENERLRKSKDKLMATGNEREYNAVTREIDSIEKMSQPREDERVTVLDELKTQTARLDAVDEDYKLLKAQVDARQETLDEELAEIKKQLDELNEERQLCSKDIPVPIFQRYEFIRERLDHPVIVALKDVICPSCHIAVPPQTFNDLLRGGQILSCPNCQRLIVSYKDYIADDPTAQAEFDEAQKEAESSRGSSPKRTSLGRSAALDRDFKEEKDDVDFVTPDDVLEDERPLGSSIENDLINMSRMADVSDLADMSEMSLGDIHDEPEENEPK